MPAARQDAHWREAIPLTCALWLFILLIFLPAIIARHRDDAWTSVALDCVTVFISMGLGLALFAAFRATIAWAGPWRFAVLGGGILAAALAQTVVDLIYTAWIAQNLVDSWRSVPTDVGRASSSLMNYLCVFTVNVALFQLSFSRHRTLTRERMLAAAESAAQRAQLEALRLQLNPHFLFNTLNAISSLILTRRNEDAELMTDKLSNFLRASLSCDPAELIPVEDELDLTNEYLEIESVRFGDRLRVAIDCSADARDQRVPGMLIQPLVENAVKYGVARSAGPVTIAIDAEMEEDTLCLTVANHGGGIAVPEGKTVSTGVGLTNVRRRLASLYGDRASLHTRPVADGFVARICIPAERAS